MQIRVNPAPLTSPSGSIEGTAHDGGVVFAVAAEALAETASAASPIAIAAEVKESPVKRCFLKYQEQLSVAIKAADQGNLEAKLDVLQCIVNIIEMKDWLSKPWELSHMDVLPSVEESIQDFCSNSGFKQGSSACNLMSKAFQIELDIQRELSEGDVPRIVLRSPPPECGVEIEQMATPPSEDQPE